MLKITFGFALICLLMCSFTAGAESKKDSLEKTGKIIIESTPYTKMEKVGGGKEVKVGGERKKLIFPNKKVVELGVKDTIVEKNSSQLRSKRKIQQQSNKNAFVSKKGNYAIIVNTTMEYLVPEDDKEAKAWDGTDASNLDLLSKMDLLDSSGNILWEKQFTENIELIKCIISDSNNVVVAITGGDPGKIPSEVPLSKVLIFNLTGDLIWEFPSERKENVGYIEAVSSILSPNGKYLFIKGDESVYFLNIRNKRSYKYIVRCSISELTDNGAAKMSIYNIQTKKRTYEIIDISKELGE